MFKDDKMCSVCGNKMEEGFIPDFEKNGQYPTRWVEGKPEKMVSGVVAFSDRQNYAVTAFRCTNCGYLDFYATEEAWKRTWGS